MKVVLAHDYHGSARGVKIIDDDMDERPIIEEHLLGVPWGATPSYYSVKCFDAEGNPKIFGDLVYALNNKREVLSQ